MIIQNDVSTGTSSIEWGHTTTTPVTPSPVDPSQNVGSYGWICPKCGGVMSPYQSFCVRCTENSNLKLHADGGVNMWWIRIIWLFIGIFISIAVMAVLAVSGDDE